MYFIYFIYFRDENKTTITVLGIIVGLLSLVLFIIVGHVLYTRCRRNSGMFKVVSIITGIGM